MTLTRDDIALFAKRIRPHFLAHLRDTAEELASWLAEAAGPKAKELRPETPFATYLEWMVEGPQSSLDQVELIMCLEEMWGIEIPDETAERIVTFEDFARETDIANFREFVERTYQLCNRPKRRMLG